MKSKDILKQALIKYDGTLILVSHDRDFLDGLITKVYEFRDKNIKQYIGGIYDFLRKKKLNSLKELEIKNQQAQFKEKEQSSANKIQYEEKKEQERELRKISNQISKSEERINVLETELEKINELLANPDKNNIADYNELFSKYESSKKEIDEEMRNWENLHLSFEEFKKT